MINEKSRTIPVSFRSMLRTGLASIRFGGEMLAHDSSVYSHELARFCSQMTMIGYDRYAPKGETVEKCGIYATLNELGFDSTEIYSSTGINEEDCVFSKAKIIADGTEQTVVIALFLGTYMKQWYTNFDSGKGQTHKSFALAADFAFEKLSEYLAKNKIGKKNLKLIISGHSRGGAVANLLGAKIAREGCLAYKKNTFTYTFATPAPTSDPERGDKKYAAVFNFINDEDFVIRCMPREWGYGRYGITFSLPSKNHTRKYDEILQDMLLFHRSYSPVLNYVPYPKGDSTVNRLFDILAGCVCSIDDFYEKRFECMGEKLSLQEYFSRTLCAITGEAEGSQEKKDGTNYLMMTSVRRAECHIVFRAVSDFFVLYEGLAGATNGKISKQYFSAAHDIAAYSAYIMACEEKNLIRR